MTDTVEDKEKAVHTLRQFLVADLNKKYQELVAFIRSIPVNPMAFHNAFHHLDCGMLWAKEAINYAEVITPAISQTIESPKEIVEAIDDAPN